MNQKNKGFSSAILLIGTAALIVLGVFAYSKSQSEQTGGAQIYQTQLSDTFNTFREQVNSSTQNLNTELETVSGTVNGFGSITSQNIPLPTNAGGTGTTTVPTNGQFLSASGASPTWKTFTFGGGIVSTTTATSVSINTTGIDPTANYAWTGNNTHTGSETFNSSTLLSEATSGVVVTNSAGQMSAVQTNASGSLLIYNNGKWSAGLGTVFSQATSTYAPSSTVLSFTIPLPTVSTGSVIEFTVNMSGPAQSLNQQGTSTWVLTAGGVSTTLAVFSFRPFAAFSIPMYGRIIMGNSTSSETVFQQNAISGSVASVVSTVGVAVDTLNMTSNPSIQIYNSGAAGTSWTLGVSSTVYMIQ